MKIPDEYRGLVRDIIEIKKQVGFPYQLSVNEWADGVIEKLKQGVYYEESIG